MIPQLTPDQYENVRPLINGLPLSLVIEGVIAGNSPALLWADDPDQPDTAVMWDGSHSFYFMGEPDEAAFFPTLRAFVLDRLVPESAPYNGGVFKVYLGSDLWKPRIPMLFTGVPLILRERVIYADAVSRDELSHLQPPEGCRIEPIDTVLLAQAHLEHLTDVISEIESCWVSLERFLEQGFGFCMCSDMAVMGWCTAEYVSEGRCGIGIETVEAYQRQGVATLTARSFVEHCRARGIRPHWDSWKRNTPSIAVAEKVGFRDPLEYRVFFTHRAGA